MFPNVQHLQWDEGSETCVYKHTAKSAGEATVAIHMTANDEQSNNKTQIRVRFHHLANRFVLEEQRIGTNTWSHADRIRTPAKSKRSNIQGKINRIDLSHGRNVKDISLDMAQACTQFQVHVLRLNTSSPNRIPRAMFLHLQ